MMLWDSNEVTINNYFPSPAVTMYIDYKMCMRITMVKGDLFTPFETHVVEPFNSFDDGRTTEVS